MLALLEPASRAPTFQAWLAHDDHPGTKFGHGMGNGYPMDCAPIGKGGSKTSAPPFRVLSMRGACGCGSRFWVPTWVYKGGSTPHFGACRHIQWSVKNTRTACGCGSRSGARQCESEPVVWHAACRWNVSDENTGAASLAPRPAEPPPPAAAPLQGGPEYGFYCYNPWACVDCLSRFSYQDCHMLSFINKLQQVAGP